MLITARCAEVAKAKAGDLRVADAVIGVGYTGVMLENGACGACFTFRNELGPKCGVIDFAGEIAGKKATELIDLAMSINLAEASLGVATINAVLNEDYEIGEEAIDVAELRPTDTVGLIGNFYPIIQTLKGRVKQLYVFERNLMDEGLIPDWAENIYLPECDVVMITGVTFINKTIDHVLSLCKNAKEVVIMGASACMAPEVLAEYGVTILAGSKVNDGERILKLISQGGGGLDVQKCLDKLCVRIAPRRD